MRILFLAPRLPWPANEGASQRSYAMLRALARKHEVTLSAPAEPNEAEECFAKLKPMIAGFVPVPTELSRRDGMPTSGGRLKRMGSYTWDMLRNRTPYTYRFLSDRYRSLIASRRPDFDAVFCRYLSMLPIAGAFPSRSIVLDADDLNYLGLARQAMRLGHGWGSILLAMESARSYCYEQSRFRELARVLVCSEADFPRLRCQRKSIMRNGIDLPDATRLRPRPDPKTIVFVGTMSYDPNGEGLRWFLKEVWPFLRELVPEIRLLVVGRNADIKTLPFAGVSGVQLVGEVEETASWISTAVLSVVPLQFGMGTRIKIIESLGCGRPVVSTRIGAEGLDAIDEQSGLFRVDDPRHMATRIGSLVNDPVSALALGERGRALIEARFTWETLTQDLACDIERWIPREYRASRVGDIGRVGCLDDRQPADKSPYAHKGSTLKSIGNRTLWEGRP